jgi:hypothetical protein
MPEVFPHRFVRLWPSLHQDLYHYQYNPEEKQTVLAKMAHLSMIKNAPYCNPHLVGSSRQLDILTIQPNHYLYQPWRTKQEKIAWKRQWQWKRLTRSWQKEHRLVVRLYRKRPLL